MTDYTRVPVETLVPHSPPMVLIDRVLSYDIKSLKAEVDITRDSRFYDAAVGGVPAWVGIEYMAQAISAWAGVQAKLKGEEIKLGFLLGTRRLKMPVKVLEAGTSYTVEIHQLLRDDSGLASFECRIFGVDQLCLEARVNVFEGDSIVRND